jgi:HSP20 family protein
VAAREPSFLGDTLGFMRHFDEEMSRMFGDFGFGPRRWMPAGLARLADLPGRLWTPDIEVFEREGKLHVRADLPGVAKENVAVEILDNFLIIKGERKHEHEEKQEGYYRSERSYGSFMRRIPLPKGVDASTAVATCQEGVLEIVLDLPKREEAAGTKIEIR